MKTRSITATELKLTTGAKRLSQAIAIIGNVFDRRTWSINGESVGLSGINWEKDFVLFTCVKSVGDGVASYRAWRVSISDAIDTVTGKLSPEIVNRRV